MVYKWCCVFVSFYSSITFKSIVVFLVRGFTVSSFLWDRLYYLRTSLEQIVSFLEVQLSLVCYKTRGTASVRIFSTPDRCKSDWETSTTARRKTIEFASYLSSRHQMCLPFLLVYLLQLLVEQWHCSTAQTREIREQKPWTAPDHHNTSAMFCPIRTQASAGGESNKQNKTKQQNKK